MKAHEGDTDEALLARAAAGDRGCFETLVRRHQASLVGFLAGILGDRTAAEDLAQEAFLRAYRRAGGFRAGSSFRTWLFAIARNGALMALRSLRRERARVEARALTAPRSVEPDGPCDAEETRRVVEALLARLSQKLRDVVVLCDLCSLSYEEAGAVLGCPVKTVSTRLFRAREMMVAAIRSRDDA